MPQLNFRYAKIEDLESIVSIYNSTIASRMVTADTEPVSVSSRIQWFKDHSPEKRPLWIIENESGQIVGWISLQSFYGRPAYDATTEISIYIAPDHRYKGYGKAALQYAIEHSPKFGVKTLLAFIFAHNRTSIQLFSQFGFAEWGNLPDIAILDGQEKSLIIMGKRI